MDKCSTVNLSIWIMMRQCNNGWWLTMDVLFGCLGLWIVTNVDCYLPSFHFNGNERIEHRDLNFSIQTNIDLFAPFFMWHAFGLVGLFAFFRFFHLLNAFEIGFFIHRHCVISSHRPSLFYILEKIKWIHAAMDKPIVYLHITSRFQLSFHSIWTNSGRCKRHCINR